MKKFFALAAICVAAVAMTLATPSAGNAQDAGNNDTADYPLGNRLFDRWIDNRRARYGRIIPAYRSAYGPTYRPAYRSASRGIVVRPMRVYGATWQAAPANTASIRVAVPPDAKVWFFNSETTQTGSERFFESPPVTPGYDYTYDIKAQWRDQDGKEVTRIRHVNMRANASVSVDFTQPAR